MGTPVHVVEEDSVEIEMIERLVGFAALERGLNEDPQIAADPLLTHEFVEGATMESRGYREKNLQVYNKSSSGDLCWRLLGSHNTKDWQSVHEESHLDAGEGTHSLISGAWNYLKVEAKSAEPGIPAKISAFLAMQR